MEPDQTTPPTDGAIETTTTAEPVVSPTVESTLAGVPDGAVINNETIVYEFDEAGNATGWHKQPIA